MKPLQAARPGGAGYVVEAGHRAVKAGEDSISAVLDPAFVTILQGRTVSAAPQSTCLASRFWDMIISTVTAATVTAAAVSPLYSPLAVLSPEAVVSNPGRDRRSNSANPGQETGGRCGSRQTWSACARGGGQGLGEALEARLNKAKPASVPQATVVINPKGR